jgi:predicted RNase H-like HicB family nuclease
MGARFRAEKRPKALLFPVIAGLDPAIHLAGPDEVTDVWQLVRRYGPGHPQQRAQAGGAERAEVMRFAIAIEKAESNYSAYVPDLPGCVATAATVSEVESEIREAIRFHIDGLKADSMSETRNDQS